MKNLFKALANFQQEVKTIHKSTQGYGYTYAELSTILDEIKPLLKKHGLGFTQLINGTSIQTLIFHVESGEHIDSTAQIPQGVELKGMNQYQVLGSAITYMRRYTLSAALGLVTDKDTDASGEQIKSETAKEDTREWLNKFTNQKKTDTTEQWNKVVEALKSGKYTLSDVEKKYKLSKEIKAELSAL